MPFYKTNFTNTTGRLIVFICLLVLASCSETSSLDDNTHQGEGEAVPLSVVVQPVTQATFGERISLTGTFTAERHARLSSRVDGLVFRLHVDAGDRVKKGQTLLELDPTIAKHALMRVKAELAEAETIVREAKRQLSLAENLAKDQFISEAQIETRKAELQQATAAASSARASLNEQTERVKRHVLAAPFEGVVFEKHTELGEWVQLGTPVFSLVDTKNIRLDLRLPQERYRHISDDSQILVFADTYRGPPLKARIGALVPVADPDARSLMLRLLVDNPDGKLLPGTSARAEISLPPEEGSLLVHSDALLRQPDGHQHVFVIEHSGGDAIARRQSVKILYEKDDLVAVTGYLRPDQFVITRGNEALENGQFVTVVGQ